MIDIEHGTYAGYQICKKQVDGACVVCKKANREYMSLWRSKNKETYALLRSKNNLLSRAKTLLANRHPEELKLIIEELQSEN